MYNIMPPVNIRANQIPGVPNKLPPFEQFHNNNHCLVLSDVNRNLLFSALLGSVKSYTILAHQKISKIWIFRKSYAGEILVKVGNLVYGSGKPQFMDLYNMVSSKTLAYGL